MSTLEEFVAPGRCMCCGSRKLMWPPQAIVDACVAWTRERGKTPRAKDWKAATPTQPSYTTVERVFGSWNGMLRAAGLFGREHGTHQWTQDDIANAMLDHLTRTGEWPQYRDWTGGCGDGSRPNTSTVIEQFGTWRAAKLYAGWDPDAASRVLPRTDCVECGRRLDEDDYTIGCNACWHRRHARARTATRNGTSLGVVESPLTPGDSDAADGNAAQRRPVNHQTEKAA
jgi:DNA-directed RNA polymerase subunit RPC12/RpoP